MGFFGTFIDLFRLSSPNVRVYTFWGMTSIVLGAIVASYLWPNYLMGIEPRKRLNWFRRKQLSQPEKTSIKVMPSPAPAPSTTNPNISSKAPLTSSDNIVSSKTSASVVPPSNIKKEVPAKTPARRAVPPTPPPTPVDSPQVVPKATTSTSTVTQVPPTTIVKDTPTSHFETTSTSTIKTTRSTELEMNKEPKLSILETEPEEKTKKKEAVIQEIHHPIQVEEIQPIVHRDRIQKEVHQVIQPYHEEVIKEPEVIEREALPEHRSAEYKPTDNYKHEYEEGLKGIVPVQEFGDTQNVVIYNEPIVEEVVKKEVINVIQPVIHREVVEPTVIKTKQPIYEEVHEQPVLYHEERPEKELPKKVEVKREIKEPVIEVKKNIHREIDTEIKSKVEMKGLDTETKLGTTIQTK